MAKPQGHPEGMSGAKNGPQPKAPTKRRPSRGCVMREGLAAAPEEERAAEEHQRCGAGFRDCEERDVVTSVEGVRGRVGIITDPEDLAADGEVEAVGFAAEDSIDRISSVIGNDKEEVILQDAGAEREHEVSAAEGDRAGARAGS